MARKCAYCNSIFEDTVMYCPNCGAKTQKVQETQKHQNSSVNNIDWRALYQKVFVEYGLVTAAIIGLFWDEVVVSFIISAAVLIAPFLEKGRIFKAVKVSRVLAIINIVLCVLSL